MAGLLDTGKGTDIPQSLVNTSATSLGPFDGNLGQGPALNNTAIIGVAPTDEAGFTIAGLHRAPVNKNETSRQEVLQGQVGGFIYDIIKEEKGQESAESWAEQFYGEESKKQSTVALLGKDGNTREVGAHELRHSVVAMFRSMPDDIPVVKEIKELLPKSFEAEEKWNRDFDLYRSADPALWESHLRLSTSKKDITPEDVQEMVRDKLYAMEVEEKSVEFSQLESLSDKLDKDSSNVKVDRSSDFYHDRWLIRRDAIRRAFGL
jgi:hypothetical protein